ncbi:MAG: DUF4254 domain-containing protein [Nannocystaceae bacterium]|nr:DUF4254 domain-containing protein [Nannocystaceae bacterium]
MNDTMDLDIDELSLQILRGLGAEIAALEQLLSTHRELWGLEDRARSRSASDESIASIKRAIDRCNGGRHRLIDAFDQSLRIPTPGPKALKFSETIGELCDRMLILSLKIASATESASVPMPGQRQQECRDKAKALSGWRAHLEACLFATLQAAASGRALLPPRSEFKMYNDPWLNPVIRRERARDNSGT